MTLKSVVDIDLNDEKFKRFSDLFNKYQDVLKKQPQQWHNTESAIDDAGDAVNKILAAFLATGQFHRELAEENSKDNKNLKHKATLWERIQKSSTGVLKDVTAVSKWMLKWGTIGFGLSLGGLFGLRSIAEDVANQRNKALGLDLNIGQEKAFGLHQGRYFNNPDALLTGAFTARANLASPAYQAIASLGINPNQSTVAIANQLLLKLQGMTKALPQQQVGNLLQEYPGLSQFGLGLQELERLRNLSPAELRGQISAYGGDAKAFNLSDRQARAFQKFLTGIDRTFGMVTKQIERDLVPLLGPIEKMVRSIGKDISMFLRSKAAAEGIDALAKGIDRFANYMASSSFKTDIRDFEDGMRSFFNVIGFSAHLISHPLSTLGEGIGDIWSGFTDWAKGMDWRNPAPIGVNVSEKTTSMPAWQEHQQSHGGNPMAAPLAFAPKPQSPMWQAPIPGLNPHVSLTVHLPAGGNLYTSVNSLNGGVGP